MAIEDLASLVEAKHSEFEAAGIDFSAWEPRPLSELPLCEVDERQRLSPHGDPLAGLLRAAGGQDAR
jgi:hypothetical protein